MSRLISKGRMYRCGTFTVEMNIPKVHVGTLQAAWFDVDGVKQLCFYKEYDKDNYELIVLDGIKEF